MAGRYPSFPGVSQSISPLNARTSYARPIGATWWRVDPGRVNEAQRSQLRQSVNIAMKRRIPPQHGLSRKESQPRQIPRVKEVASPLLPLQKGKHAVTALCPKHHSKSRPTMLFGDPSLAKELRSRESGLHVPLPPEQRKENEQRRESSLLPSPHAPIKRSPGSALPGLLTCRSHRLSRQQNPIRLRRIPVRSKSTLRLAWAFRRLWELPLPSWEPR